MANYVVDERLLMPYLPNGTTLDLYEGRCYVSLVGFLFQDTKLRGIRVPFHVKFEEVNLRLYVRRGEKRGVVFVKEVVPRRALQLVASTFYGEPYVTAPMRHEWREETAELSVSYEWKLGGRWHKLQTNNLWRQEAKKSSLQNTTGDTRHGVEDGLRSTRLYTRGGLFMRWRVLP
jgi:uncharacterized protein YqjF (DUF2071 family)